MEYLALVACYLLGAIPFGVIVGKVTRGIDIRDFGSGNIGATNVLRTLGLGPAIAVFFFDTVKGLVAVELCKALPLHSPRLEYVVVAGGILSIVGHSFSCFLRFRGGKGVATSLGMIIGLNAPIAAIAFVMWVALAGLTRYISIASIVASTSVPMMMFLWEAQHVPPAYQAVATVAAGLILAKHKTNIKRLLNGTESKLGQRVDVDKDGGTEDNE